MCNYFLFEKPEWMSKFYIWCFISYIWFSRFFHLLVKSVSFISSFYFIPMKPVIYLVWCLCTSRFRDILNSNSVHCSVFLMAGVQFFWHLYPYIFIFTFSYILLLSVSDAYTDSLMYSLSIIHCKLSCFKNNMTVFPQRFNLYENVNSE